MGEDPDPGDPAVPGGRPLSPGRAAERAATARALLRELAALHDVQLSYVDLTGRRRHASEEAVMAVLRSLGAPVEDPGDLPGAIRARREASWGRVLEPVTVAWGGRLRGVPVRLPARAASYRLRVVVTLEGGRERGVRARVRDEPVRVAGLGRRRFAELRLDAPDPLPPGYHRLTVAAGNVQGTTMVVSAPRRPKRPEPARTWGVFLPLYALRSRRSWGTGDLGDLERLVAWVAGLGGSVVATLPLMAAFLDEPFQPSPYSPASRLFWNELYLDVPRIPEAGASADARAMMASGELRRAVAGARRRPLVDYREAMALKRPVLEAMARHLFEAGPPARRADFERFVGEHPRAEDYAGFRAACERHRRPWWAWPESERRGRLPRRRVDEDARRYHLYVQWATSEQMEEAGRTAREAGAGLYFDLPLGVNTDGYDVWRERDAFLTGTSAGAPPDGFFTGGQDWGFPPLHPDNVREQGYRYPIACFRHLLRHAGVLRIDHVMGLHRIFCVPHGFAAQDGLYVRYRPEEAYAILSLESQRTGTVVVGEDLGTVPGFIRRALERHGIYRSYVMQNEFTPDPRRAVRPPPERSLASLNTHDMPPFAAFWSDTDVEDRLRLGWLGEQDAGAELRGRRRVKRAVAAQLRREGRLRQVRARASRSPEDETAVVLRGSLEHLAAGPARVVVVNMEDLWLEPRPQNVPGTVVEYPNWRRKARFAFESFATDPAVVGTLEVIDQTRKETST